MKNLLLLTTIILTVVLSAPAKAQWFWQNPKPQGNTLRDVHVFDDNNVIAIGEAGTTIRTTDGGANWSIQSTDIYLTAIHFINQNIGWAVGYDYDYSNGVILKTGDGGLSWLEVYSISELWLGDVYFIDALNGWVTDWGYPYKILKTSDGGTSWVIHEIGTTFVPLDIFFVSANTGWFVGSSRWGGNAIFKSIDGGENWTAQYQPGYCGLTSIYFTDDSTGWAAGGQWDCGDQSYNSGIILATTNGGEEWFTQVDSLGSSFNSVYFTNNDNGWIVGADYDNVEERVLILKTNDRGANWTVVSDSIKGVPYSLSFSESGTGWIVGSSGMLIKSTDDDWVLQSKCHFNGNLISAQFLDDSKGWILGTSDDGSNSSRLYKSIDGGEHWITQISGMSGYLKSFCFVNENVGWVAGINDALNEAILLKTTNGGVSWTDQSFGSDLYLLSIYFADENTGWVVGVDFNATHEGMIYKTTNGGESWINQYTTQNIGEYRTSFFVDNSTGWVIFFGWGSSTIVKTVDGGENWAVQPSPMYYPTSVYFIDQNIGWITGTSSEATSVILKTTDGGASWSDQIENDSQYFNSIYFVDQNNGWVVGLDNSYRSIALATTDGGLNWISQPTGSSRRLNSVYFTDKNTGWAVGENGTILKTTNGGGTIPVELISLTAFTQSGYVELNWSTATETNNMMFEIERRKGNSEFVLIGFVEGKGTTTEHQEYSYVDRNVTTGKYYYRLKQIDFDGTFEYTDEIEVDAAPQTFSLEQNYPNPFNPSTKITYSIPYKSFVTLKVYDALGSLVGELVQEEKEAGKYEVNFTASGLSSGISARGGYASGIYFYKLQAGDFVETKKMILIK